MTGPFVNIKICVKCEHLKAYPWNDEQINSPSRMLLCGLNGTYVGWGYPKAAKPEYHNGLYANLPDACPYLLEHIMLCENAK